MALDKFKLGPLQQKWVDTLRSGKHEQARATLHDVKDGGYCCLGIACSLIENPDIRYQYDDEEDEGDTDKLKAYWGEGQKASFEILPDHIMDMYKFIDPSGGYTVEDVPHEDYDLLTDKFEQVENHNSLAELNDEGKFTFENIADFVEEWPHLVFLGPA